jgi:hypothetical protein
LDVLLDDVPWVHPGGDVMHRNWMHGRGREPTAAGHHRGTLQWPVQPATDGLEPRCGRSWVAATSAAPRRRSPN